MAEPILRTVQLVTLAFPGGAENRFELGEKDQPEFEGVRASMIIYGMRWWFRALAGGIRGTDDLESIRTAESAIFGTSQNIELNKQKFEGLSSRVRVTVLDNVAPAAVANFDLTDLWLKYLAYGLFKTDRAENWVRKYVKEGAKFTFRLQVADPRGKDSREPEIAPALVAALADLWIDLGGLGARWRHGLGGMRRADAGDLGNGAQHAKQVMKKIAEARKLVKEFLDLLVLPAAKPHPKTPSFPIVKEPHFQLAWRANAGPDAMEALRTVHGIWRGTRQKERGNVRSSSQNAALYRDVVDGGTAQGYEVLFAGLGLPIPFGFPQLGSKATGSVKPADLLDEKLTRRASPIWFRVVRVNDKQFGLLAMLWDCEYLPEGSGAVVQKSDKDAPQWPVPYVNGEAAAWFAALLKNPADRFVRG